MDVGYAEAGPADGPAVLLHGWPYDIHSYVEVAPLLAAARYRVIVPHLRGHGTTRFLAGETFRNGQQSVIALDIIALMDALEIEHAVLAGYDRGARTADIIAALWPERCKAVVSVSGYLIGSPEANKMPLPPKAGLAWWYQYHFVTERGRAGYNKYWHDFAKLIWQTASPKWNFDDATFDRSAASLNHPDHVSIVIHNYRWRLGLAEGDPPVHHTRTAAPLPTNSRANMRIGSSKAVSGTTCRGKHPGPSPRRSSRSTATDGRAPAPPAQRNFVKLAFPR